MKKKLELNYQLLNKLRYGENPHQKGWFWKKKTVDPLALFKFKKIQGKKLSFTNLLDIDAAVNTLCLIGQELPACVVVKHTNPCGVSVNKRIDQAFQKAWAGDSLAAFGGIIALNRLVGVELAKLILADNRFFEIIVCPQISPKAGKEFRLKKNLRVLVNPALRKPLLNKDLDFKKIRGGLLSQQTDVYQLKKKDLTVVTKKKPTDKEVDDLLFAWKIAQISKANSIVLVKNQQLIGSGVGQQDRLRSCQLAVDKAGQRAKASLAASDAFFPFKDGPEILIKAGVKAIIQPGGSIRDRSVINFCNQHDTAMVFTAIRCFKH